MRIFRLQGRKTSAFLLRRGNVWKGKTFMARWLPGPPKHPSAKPNAVGLYVGTFASAKLNASAVKRNRMRRRVREALRKTAQESTKSTTAQLLLSPRSASLDAPYEDIVRDVASLLAQLPAWQPRKPLASGNS